MQMGSRILPISALAFGIVGALAFGQAQASGFQLRENSVKSLGRAATGTGVAQDDPSVVFNNPAAMAFFDQRVVQADITGIDLTAKFKGGGLAAAPIAQAMPSAAPALALGGGDGGDPGSLQAVPAIAAVFPVGNGWAFGASINAPFGLKTEYDRDWVGRYNAVESNVKGIDFTVSGAYAFSPQFSLGLGVVYQRMDVTLSNAIDFGTALCAQSGNPANCFNPAFPFHPQGADGFAEVKGDDNDFGWIVGLEWRPSENFSLSYSHRSKIKHRLEGTADFTVPGSVAAAFQANGITAYNDTGAYAPLTTPQTDTISAQWNIDDQFRLMADVQRTGWDSLQSVDIYRKDGTLITSEPFEWRNTMYYGIGGEWDVNEMVTLRAGIASDQTPTKDATRDPRLPDNDRMLYSLGLTWHISDALALDAAYERVQIDSSNINTVSSSGSTLVGKFDGHADLYGVALQYKF